MAAEAERLLADTAWLPEPLRTGEVAVEDDDASGNGDADEDLPEFLAGDIDADEGADGDPDGELEHLDAAE